MGSEQVYDIIILILVGWLTLRGAMKGMVSQLASLAAVAASFWASVRFGPVLEPIMQSTLKVQPPWDKVLAITIAFVGASIAVAVLHRVLAKIISAIRLKKYDMACGAGIGFLKGVLIGMIITFFAIMLSEQSREMVLQSRSGKVLVRAIQYTQALLPEDVSVLIETNLEGFQRQIEQGKATAEQVQDASKTTSYLLGAIQKIQDGVSTITQRNTGTNDPADDAPMLSDDTSSRQTSSPFPFLSSQRPATTTAQEEPIPMDRLVSSPPAFATSATGFSGTPTGNSSAGYPNASTANTTTLAQSNSPTEVRSSTIVAPSIGMQPMTFPAASSTANPRAEPDWQTLFRNIK